MTDMSFRGFPRNRYTPVPDLLFDELLAELSNDELRVLLYVIRRTEGFKRETDNISLNQFAEGIVRSDGTRLDRGAGLSRAATSRGLKGLVTRGILMAQQNTDVKGGRLSTTYAVRFEATPSPPVGYPLLAGGLGVAHRREDPSPPADLQETVLQETEQVEREPEELRQVWARTLEQLRTGMTAANYRTWLADTCPLRRQGNTLVVGAPSDFVREWLQTRFRLLVRRVLQDLDAQLTDVVFEVISREQMA